MRPILFTVPLVMLMAATSAGQASAAPISAIPPAVVTDTSIIQVGGCHNNTHVHYVPEWGITTAHHHKGRYCRPVQDENDMPLYHRFDGPTLYFNFGDDDDHRHRRHHRRHHDN